MAAYYNEIDRHKAEWLRELMRADLIAPGDVDERSIKDVRPDDLRGYVQCHFFAGIGIWSYALRLAGWPDDREVWTGSCPCQPFSVAGQGVGFADPRHLWPDFYRLISGRNPVVVFGEQVASKPGLAWLDLVQVDMEKARYAFGSVDFCAAGVGSPHIRQRLYWVADSPIVGRDGGWPSEEIGRQVEPERFRDAGGLAHSDNKRLEERERQQRDAGQECAPTQRTGDADCLEDSLRSERWPDQWERGGHRDDASDGGDGQRVRGPVSGFWAGADWVLTRPQRMGDCPGLRPVKPGTFPLASRLTGRVPLLRGAGDGIVAEQAAAFIRSYLDVTAALSGSSDVRSSSSRS